MSSRAIQRLREEREAKKVEPGGLDEIDEEEEDHDGSNTRKAAFLAMMNDSDSESEEEEELSNDESKGKYEGEDEGERNDTAAAAAKTVVPADTDGREEKQQHHNAGGLKDNELELEQEEEEEDIDAILKEFESKDEALEQDSKPSAPWFHAIVSNMDARDLDIDYVMRTTLLGGGEEAPPPVASRRSRQTFLFGPARDGWVRPPHYVGGGIGMSNYFDQAGSNKRHLPWPYSSPPPDASLDPACEQWQDSKNWFTFVHSDTYDKDLKDYERIQNSGDVNALALFVAHHPFVVEALLQLAMVLYRTNQSQEGLSLLRRSLWILECSSLPSFRPLQGAACFMDYDQPENASYFLALFRMIQISGMQG